MDSEKSVQSFGGHARRVVDLRTKPISPESQSHFAGCHCVTVPTRKRQIPVYEGWNLKKNLFIKLCFFQIPVLMACKAPRLSVRIRAFINLHVKRQ